MYRRIVIFMLLLVLTALLPANVCAKSASSADSDVLQKREPGVIGFTVNPEQTTPRPASLEPMEITEEAVALSLEFYNNLLNCDPEMFLYNDKGIKSFGFWGDPTDAEYEYLKAKSAEVTAGCTTASEKIFAVTKYIATNICYDYDYYSRNLYDWTHVNLDPYDVLVNESTICDGYARSTATLLQLAGVPCIYVGSPNHAWNMAYNGERWMLIDTTWISGGSLDYGVLNKSDDMWMDWYDFTIDFANENEAHLITGLPYAISDGVLTAFPKYTAQAEVTVPAGITSIDTAITASESDITTVTLPASLTSVSSYCFQGSLSKVIYDGTSSEYRNISISSANTALTGCKNIVYRDNAAAPQITTHPKDTLAGIGVEVTLTAAAQSNGGTVTYQWYRNTARSATGGTAIDGASSNVYTFSPDETGKFYYYMTATAKDTSAGGSQTGSVSTTAAEVYVFEEVPTASGRIGGDVRFYTLPNAGITYLIGSGEVSAQYIHSSMSGTSVYISKDITYIPEELLTSSLGYSKGYVVEDGNTRYASDDSGAIYDIIEHKLICLPLYSQAADLDVLDGTEIINENAIMSSRLENLTLPASLKTIVKAPGRWISLSSITIDSGNTAFYVDDYGALIDIAVNRLVMYGGQGNSTYVMPDEITYVEAYAFNYANIDDISLSENLKSIGKYAFYNTSLSRVTFPASLESIGDEAFSYCYNLTDVYFLGTPPASWGTDVFVRWEDYDPVTIHYADNAADWTTPVWKDVHGTEYAAYPFDPEIFGSASACGDYAVWTISGDTLIISGKGDMWNYGYNNAAPWQTESGTITKIVVKRGITSIGSYAFYKLNQISEVELPLTLTSIGDHAFFNIHNLESITFPAGLEEIGEYTFEYCYNLTDIRFTGDVPDVWGTSALPNPSNYGDIVLYYPEGNTSGWTSDTWIAPDERVYNTRPFIPGAAGYQVSGTVSVYGSADVPVTVSLIDSDGFALESAAVLDGKYSFADVSPDTYIIQAKKSGHFTAVGTVTVEAADVSLSLALTLIGDINGNLTLDAEDISILSGYFAGNTVSIPTEIADADEDGTFTRKDVMLIARYYAGWKTVDLPYTDLN